MNISINQTPHELPEGATLADAFVDLVDQGKTDVVVIVDEVQHAMGSEDGNSMLLALKAARDAGNKKVMEDPRMDPASHGDTPEVANVSPSINRSASP